MEVLSNNIQHLTNTSKRGTLWQWQPKHITCLLEIKSLTELLLYLVQSENQSIHVLAKVVS